MLNPVTSRQLAIISTTVMSAREDFDFRKEWKGVCGCIPIKGHFYANLYPKAWSAFQCLTALSLVPLAPCLYGLMGWLVDIAMPTSECVEVSWWLVGFWIVFGFYLWDMCWIELFRDGVQRAAWEPGMSLRQIFMVPGCSQFSWGFGADCSFLEHAAHRPENCCLLLLRQPKACPGTPSWFLNTET